jgi:cysteine-rich repeat protein
MPALRTNSTVLTNVLAALVLLLASGAQAQTVLFEDGADPTKATGIDGLVVPGVNTFNVRFDVSTSATDIYGPFPGDLVTLPPFFGVPGSEAASNAINAALHGANALGVGEVDGLPGSEFYNIGTTAFICCMIPILDDPEIPSVAVVRNITEGGVDWFLTGENFLAWDLEPTTWAVFSMSGSVCGNNVLELGEQCDDGNTTPGDGCSATCTIETAPVCGNRVVELGEECDDGNTTSGDGCSDMCLIEEAVCGNSIVEVGEECDDGNTVSGDGCSDICTIEQSQDLQVLFEDVPGEATGINDLVVPGVGTFDVTFDVSTDAESLYGPFPGDEVLLPPFSSVAETEDATNAANVALTQAGADTVGNVDGQSGTPFYSIPTVSFVLDEIPFIGPYDALGVARSAREGVEWLPLGENFLFWANQETTYATFTPVPEPSAVLSAVAALGALSVLARRRRRRLATPSPRGHPES